MSRKINYFIDIGLLFLFIANFGTGFIKFLVKYPAVLRVLGIQSLPMYTLSEIHDWSGLFMGILILIHLLLHWRWIVAMTRALIREKMKKVPIIILLMSLVVVSGCTEAPEESKSPDESPVKDLDDVEITEYEGEKLTSFSAVRTTSIKGPQEIEKETYRLTLTGLVNTEKELTYEDVLAFQRYRKVMTLHCVEGWSITVLWEGVLVKDLLDMAGIAPQANTVIFYAYDGYSTSLPLDYITNNNILLAYKMNNVTLTPEKGFPFQLVAEEKWGYKWIKWVTKIELSDDPNYKGYWEQRGYNQDGDVEGPMFEED